MERKWKRKEGRRKGESGTEREGWKGKCKRERERERERKCGGGGKKWNERSVSRGGKGKLHIEWRRKWRKEEKLRKRE